MNRFLACLAAASLVAPSPLLAQTVIPVALPTPSVNGSVAATASISPAALPASFGMSVGIAAPTLAPSIAPTLPSVAALRVQVRPAAAPAAVARSAAADLRSLSSRLAPSAPALPALRLAFDGGESGEPVSDTQGAVRPSRSGLAKPTLLARAAAAAPVAVPVLAAQAAASSGMPTWVGFTLLGGGIVGLLFLVRWIEGSFAVQHYLAKRRWITGHGKKWSEAEEADREAVKMWAEKIVAANRAGRANSWSDVFRIRRRARFEEPETPERERGGLTSLGLRDRTGGVATPVAKAPPKPKITFAQVAGQAEAKRELQRVVDFLKNPERYKAVGAKGFKGVLLFGPPGTGKTLFARAVAGEADARFVDRKGSDFVNTYVGVGPASVRGAFSDARGDGTKPGILFIDEIDAIGKKRDGAGNQEYENTLNALLAEMSDPKNDNVVLFAATNRPELLDPALMRGRRFGLQVPVGLPDVEGREAILGVHTAGMKLAADFEPKLVAKLTPGLSGADLEEIANDAAMMAAEAGAEAVDMGTFRKAIDRRMIGHERRLIMSDAEKKVVAVHESGHALTAWLLPNADPIRKITIVPHGLKALGLVQTVSEEERYLHSKTWILDRIAVALGGRVAEEMVTGDVYSGALDDLEQATRLARMMVMKLGMSAKVGRISYDMDGEKTAAGRALSQSRLELIEEEVRAILDEQYARVQKLLTENRATLEKLSGALQEKETLREADLDGLLPARPK